MTKERLINNMLNIPISDFNKPPKDENCIKDHDGSVRYRMTRHQLQNRGNSKFVDGFFLSLAGPVLERAKFIKDMKDKLGEPVFMYTGQEYPGVILIAWNAKEVTKRLQN